MTKRNYLETIIFILLNSLNIILVWLGSLFFFGILFALVSGGFVRLSQLTSNENAFTAAAFSSGLAILLSPLSLIPSYKLSLKLAKTLQYRGWEIKNPKQLLWVSVGFLFLPVILLIWVGAVLAGLV